MGNTLPSYRGVPCHPRQAPKTQPWICVRPGCDEARPGNLPRPICCPRCGAKIMRAGPFLKVVER